MLSVSRRYLEKTSVDCILLVSNLAEPRVDATVPVMLQHLQQSIPLRVWANGVVLVFTHAGSVDPKSAAVIDRVHAWSTLLVRAELARSLKDVPVQVSVTSRTI